MSTCTSNVALSRLELVLPRAVYDLAVKRQLTDLDAYAIGPVRWRQVDGGLQLLVERLETTTGVPQGWSRPPLDSYLVLHVEYARPGWSPEELLAKVAPLRSHQAAALVLYVDDRGATAGWDAVWRGPEGEIRPLAAVRVQGPAPLLLTREDGDEPQSPAEQERWSRTAGALGAETFARVRRAEVNLIGAGRNGTLAAQQLAALGVARLRIIDGDQLEPHNVVGTLGLDADDLGLPKVQAVAKACVRLRPELTVACWERSLLDPVTAADLRQKPADLIVSTVDTDAARLAAWLLARETLTPHLDIASAVLPGDSGPERLADVRLFIPGSGQGCPVCVGGIANLDDTLYALNAPPLALQRGSPRDWSADRLGSLPTLNSIAVGVGVQLWLDYLSGSQPNSVWQRLRWTGSGIESAFARVASDNKCSICKN